MTGLIDDMRAEDIAYTPSVRPFTLSPIKPPLMLDELSVMLVENWLNAQAQRVKPSLVGSQ